MANEVNERFGCLKRDMHGETDCKDAAFCMEAQCMYCTHQCVVALQRELRKATARADRAEAVLEKYREAIRPVVRNCRVIVEFADKAKEVRDGK